MDEPADKADPVDPVAILGGVAAPVVVYDREMRFAYANIEFCRSVHKTWDELAGKRVRDVFPESQERMDTVMARFDRAFAGEITRSVAQPYQIAGPDGRMRERYWRSMEKPVFGPDGTVTHVVQSGEDVTEEILLRRQRDVIASELEHRVRNTLAMAGSLAMIIGQNTPSVEAFIESFTDRLEAMGRNLTMISDHEWRGLPLRAIIEAELAQVVSPGDPRVEISGPDVLLEMRSARWMALLVHELVKNAVRHGCFSVPGGSLRVRWALTGQTLTADWVETGAKVLGPPAHTGFGTQMLSLMPMVGIDRVFGEQGMSLKVKVTSSMFSRIVPPVQRPPETLK